VEPVKQCRAGASHMKVSAGAGGESCSNGFHLLPSSMPMHSTKWRFIFIDIVLY
jgi:hypothetical protein